MPKQLPARTHMGRVALSVADLDRSLAYYQDRIGLSLLRMEGKTAVLGTPERELLHLHEQPGARPDSIILPCWYRPGWNWLGYYNI